MTTKIQLNPEKIERAARKLKVAVHPDRLRILELLEEKKELNVTQIYEKMKLKQAEASHHLTMMLEYGILKKVRRGKESIYSVTPGLIKMFAEITDELCKWSSD